MAIGVVVAVCSAWVMPFLFGSVSRGNTAAVRLRHPERGEGRGDIRLRISRGWCGTQFYCNAGKFADAPPVIPADGSIQHQVPAWARPVLFPWEHGLSPWPPDYDPTDPFASADRRLAYAFGWPARSFWWEWDRGSPVGGFDLDRLIGAGGPLRTSRVLPLRPIWTGIVINASMFGAGIWTAWLCCTRARCRYRIARDRCARCCYDLRGTTLDRCPECGMLHHRA